MEFEKLQQAWLL